MLWDLLGSLILIMLKKKKYSPEGQQTPSLASSCLGRQEHPVNSMGLSQLPDLDSQLTSKWLAGCPGQVPIPIPGPWFPHLYDGATVSTLQGGCGDSIRCSTGAVKGTALSAAVQGGCQPWSSTCSECPGRVCCSHQPTPGQALYQAPDAFLLIITPILQINRERLKGQRATKAIWLLNRQTEVQISTCLTLEPSLYSTRMPNLSRGMNRQLFTKRY